MTVPYLAASFVSQLAALAMDEGSAVAGPTALPTPTLPSARYRAGIPNREFPGTHPAAPSGTVYPQVRLVVTPPCTICSFSAWVICASIASARASGVPDVVMVVVVVVEVEDDGLPPHAASPRTRGRISSRARSAFALRIPNINTPRLQDLKPQTS